MINGFSVLAASMPTLSIFQYNAVDNIFSMTVATMGAAAVSYTHLTLPTKRIV